MDARAPWNQGDPVIDCPYCKHSFSPNASIYTREKLLNYLTEVGKRGANEEGDSSTAGLNRKSDDAPDKDNEHTTGPHPMGGEACAVIAEKNTPGKEQHRKGKNNSVQISMPVQKKRQSC